MLKLSIIIPYHNEDVSLITDLLSSLNMQVKVDWSKIEIIISNNCNEPKKLDSLFKQYKNIYPVIKYVECPIKGGMGQNRQHGLNIASGEYVLFSDCDDHLTSPLSIANILNELDSGCNLYLSNIRVERLVVVNQSGITLENNATHYLLHGKIYKKQFLTDRGIHFCEHIFAAEDLYFNFVCSHFGEEFHTVDGFYTWKYRGTSVSNDTGLGGTGYMNKYPVDTMIFLYYAVRDVKLSGFLSEAEMMKVAAHAMIYLQRERHRILSTDSIAQDIGKLILSEFPIDESEIVRSFPEAITWIKSIDTSDVEDVRNKYNVKSSVKFEYKPTEIKYIK